MNLTNEEQRIAGKIRNLKQEAGSHSPSMFTIAEKIPELDIKVDACFLSNPYATELFLQYLREELIDSNKMRDILEFYPSQNSVIADVLAEHLQVPGRNVFIGNGAIEIIQAVIHSFTKRKIVVNIPTFSSYYEFVKDGVEVIFNKLQRENNFELDIEQYLQLIREQQPDTVVLINPNNPNGSYVRSSDMRYLLENLQQVDTVIVDESFIHFAFETEEYKLRSSSDLTNTFKNLVIVKSMSKDFGIAGIRAGYAIMDEQRILHLLKNGYLWNSNGLAEYFFRLYTRRDFLEKYNKVRIEYIKQTQKFMRALGDIHAVKVYPSMANFALVELSNGSNADEFVFNMLIRYGIYMRTCSDKIGLEGQFIRIASRKKEENTHIVQSLRNVYQDTTTCAG